MLLFFCLFVLCFFFDVFCFSFDFGVVVFYLFVNWEFMWLHLVFGDFVIVFVGLARTVRGKMVFSGCWLVKMS